MKPTERVTIDVSITCYGCGRKLVRHVDLDGDSLKTGNYTQRAAYHLQEMNKELLDEAERRTWESVDGKGWRCAHCGAKEVDRRAGIDDPIDRAEAEKGGSK